MMAEPADYPIVFLDVDGTLIPFRARPAESAPVASRLLIPAEDASGNPLLDRLDPADGRSLLAGRPFIWLDDEITQADRRWVQAHYPGKALLHRVDPFLGLTDVDFTQIRQWLAAR